MKYYTRAEQHTKYFRLQNRFDHRYQCYKHSLNSRLLCSNIGIVSYSHFHISFCIHFRSTHTFKFYLNSYMKQRMTVRSYFKWLKFWRGFTLDYARNNKVHRDDICLWINKIIFIGTSITDVDGDNGQSCKYNQ